MSNCAYVTFLEGDSEYLLGVLALARSLKLNQCKFKLIVCCTPTVPPSARERLAAEPNVEVRGIEWLELPAHLATDTEKLANPQFVRNFTKLRLWQLTDLNKCVYLDADALALSCLDDMFLAPAFSAVLDNMAADAEFSETKFQTPGWAVRTAHAEPKRSYFNAGVFVFEPSEAEFNSMMEDLATFPLTRFAEQDFLNARHAGRWNQLPLSFNWGKPSFWLCPQLCCFDALKVVHFSGRLKPWMRARDGTWRATDVAAASPIERAAVCGKDATPPDENLARAVDRWWAAFDSGHGALASVRGATAQPAEPSSVVLRELPAPAPSPSVSKAAPPKLLFVVHRAYPHDGGSEYYVHWLASEAASRGVQVTVLAGTHKGSQGDVRVTSDLGILTSERFDAIVVHGSDCTTQDQVLTELGAGRVASPVVYLIIKPSDSPTSLAGLRHAALVGCSTAADWAHARAHGVEASRLAQITHGVDARTASGAPGFRARHAIPPNGRLFVSAGGFGPHKRMLELARAFGAARREGDVLILFGYQQHPDGEDYLDACRTASEGVRVVLGAPRQEVLDALAEADLYVMHSEWEGFGLVLIEAMLNGCCWAANARAGAATDLGRFGYAYADDEELISIMQRARRLPPQRRKALQLSALTRYSVRTPIDELHRALARRAGTGVALGSAPPPPMPPCHDPPLLPPSASARRRACYATLLHGSGDYYLGVLALKHSLDRAGAKLPFVVAVTEAVPESHRAVLRAAGCEVRAEALPRFARSARGALRREFVACFAKLALWGWTEYDAVVYVDGDMVVTRSLDHLADVELPEPDVPLPIAAARDLGDATRRTGLSRTRAGKVYFNAGLMVLRPSAAACAHLEAAAHDVHTLSLPYAEQDLLNDHVDTALLELPQTYNCHVDKLGSPEYEAEVDAACGALELPAVFHYCGPKPWRTLPPVATAPDAQHADAGGVLHRTRSAAALDEWWKHGAFHVKKSRRAGGGAGAHADGGALTDTSAGGDEIPHVESLALLASTETALDAGPVSAQSSSSSLEAEQQLVEAMVVKPDKARAAQASSTTTDLTLAAAEARARRSA